MSRPSQRLLGSAESIGGEIRRRIAGQTGLTASVGIAPNKLLAKIASDLNKPDGMCRIDADNMREILDAIADREIVRRRAEELAGRACRGHPHLRRFAPGRRRGAVARLRQAWKVHARSCIRPRRSAGRSRIAKRNRSARRRPMRGTCAGRRRSRAVAAARRPDGLAAAGAPALRRQRERQDPPCRFHDLHPPARTRAAHAGHRGRVGGRADSARRAGWPSNPMPQCGYWGSAVSDLQTSQQAGFVRRPSRASLAAGLGDRRHPRPLRVRHADPRQPCCPRRRLSGS